MKQKGGVIPWFPGLIVSAAGRKTKRWTKKKNKRKVQKGRGLKRYYRR